ncbi:30S ribosomal protein S4 [Candidatus Woesearchaeota archaeon]|nr:30S ribosomal protein S4 [Candidatus Woesearchaeota archaeon]
MGDPRRMKNKYSTPIHPWEKLRLEAEKPLMKEYGLVNKKELWKVSSKLKNFKDNAKKLVASKSEQAIAEKKQMVDRMKSYGLITSDVLDEILGLDIQQLLDRRLQTVVFKKGLARTIKQARQMITHRHIAVNGIKITAPGYLVKVSEEASVIFMPSSSFSDESHPERAVAVEEPVKVKEVVKESKKVPAESSDAKEELKEELAKEVAKESESDDKKSSKEEVKVDSDESKVADVEEVKEEKSVDA